MKENILISPNKLHAFKEKFILWLNDVKNRNFDIFPRISVSGKSVINF